MARGKMDQELLALSRAARHIEDLDDPRAQARVATYLAMRYTSAGEQQLPSEERAKHITIGLEEPDPRQMALPGTVPAMPPRSPMLPETPTDGATSTAHAGGAHNDATAAETTADDATAATAEPAVTGWGLSGNNDGADDEAPTAAPPRTMTRAPKRTVKATADESGWDLSSNELVEVKI